MNTLQDLFLQETRQLLGAERHLATLFPQIAGMTVSPELRTTLNEHMAQTQSHIYRLENLMEAMGQPVSTLPCPSLEAITSEVQDKLTKIHEPQLKEAYLIAAQQKVNHFEIAAYGTAQYHALQLDIPAAAELLQRTLQEEKETDERLCDLAEHQINEQADSVDMPGI